LQFRPEDKPFNATVIGVRFYRNTVKYDLEIFWDDQTVEITEQKARVYNIHSKFVLPA
jgi:hypothetical protein